MVIYLLFGTTIDSPPPPFFPVLCEVGLVPRNNQLGCDWWRAERSGPSRVTWPSEVRCYEVLCDNSRAVLFATVLLGASFIMSVGLCSTQQRGPQISSGWNHCTALALPTLQSIEVNDNSTQLQLAFLSFSLQSSLDFWSLLSKLRRPIERIKAC